MTPSLELAGDVDVEPVMGAMEVLDRPFPHDPVVHRGDPVRLGSARVDGVVDRSLSLLAHRGAHAPRTPGWRQVGERRMDMERGM